MKVVGFNLSKVNAHKEKSFRPSTNINTDFKITDVQKDTAPVFNSDLVNTSFTLTFSYTEKDAKKDSKPTAMVLFEGSILLTSSDEEIKDLFKSWKKKEVPPAFKISLMNVALKKCSPRAILLEDDLNLPFHLPVPQLKLKSKSEDQEK